MSEITICEKPEWISYDDILRLMDEAHRNNRSNGIKINTKITDGESLKRHIGSDSVCFVALDGDRMVGTVSVVIRSGSTYCTKEAVVGCLMHLAVLPDSAGKNLGKRLCEKVEQYAKEREAAAVELIVVEKNPARAFYSHIGYEPIKYIPRKNLSQYSVLMIKRLGKCRYPRWLCAMYFQIRRKLIRLRYRYPD